MGPVVGSPIGLIVGRLARPLGGGGDCLLVWMTLGRPPKLPFPLWGQQRKHCHPMGPSHPQQGSPTPPPCCRCKDRMMPANSLQLHPHGGHCLSSFYSQFFFVRKIQVDGGSKDSVFTTNSHNDDCHPRSPLDEDRMARWRVRRDVSHSSLPRSLSLVTYLSQFAGWWRQGQPPPWQTRLSRA